MGIRSVRNFGLRSDGHNITITTINVLYNSHVYASHYIDDEVAPAAVTRGLHRRQWEIGYTGYYLPELLR